VGQIETTELFLLVDQNS